MAHSWDPRTQAGPVLSTWKCCPQPPVLEWLICVHSEKHWSVRHVQLFCDPMDCSLSMGFSRHEYWSGLPFPSLEDLPDPGIETASPALQVGSSPLSPQGSPQVRILGHCCSVKTVVSLITTSWRSKTEEMSFQ